MLLLASLAWSLLASAAPQDPGHAPAKDPFAPGLRWTLPSDPSTPWIPRDVAFVGDGELVWAAPALQNPALLLLASAELGDAEILFADRDLAGAIGEVRVAAGDTAGELFSLAQFPAPTAATRRSVVSRHDALAAALGAPFAPVWSHDVGPAGNGPARIAATPDGGVLVAAAHDATTATVRIEGLDPADGVPLFGVTLPGNGLGALVLDGDGSRIALAAGAHLWVLDAQGNPLWHRVPPSATGAIALSADGTTLAHGGAGRLDVLRLQGTVYASALTRPVSPEEVTIEVALSDDGRILAATWWNAVTGVDVRLELIDTATGAVLREYAQTGAAGGLQNYPAAFRLSGDGERAALGLWGSGDSAPELVLLDRRSPEPVLAADLPGSVFALALDRGATRVAVGTKATHANLFSSSGALSLHDTGERDLQLLAAVRPGGTALLAYRMPEPGVALFAAGIARPLPLPFRGANLWIDWSRFHLVRSGTVGAGRASLVLPIPPDPGLVGLPLAVQAATLGAGGLRISPTLVRPAVL